MREELSNFRERACGGVQSVRKYERMEQKKDVREGSHSHSSKLGILEQQQKKLFLLFIYISLSLFIHHKNLFHSSGKEEGPSRISYALRKVSFSSFSTDNRNYDLRFQ
jgi:hypothetical protein